MQPVTIIAESEIDAFDAAVCQADLRQTGVAFTSSALGLGAFRYLQGLKALSTGSAQAWGNAAVVGQVTKNAALLPAFMAAGTAAKSGGTANPFEGNYATAYSLAKSVPVLGVGLELGEAMNSCIGLGNP